MRSEACQPTDPVCSSDRRGQPPFWRSDSGVALGSPEYLAAYEAAIGIKPAVARNDGKLRGLILAFYGSTAFTKLASKTKRDYQRGLTDVDKKWGDAPKAALENAALRSAVKKWIENNWSGKEADHRLTPFKRVLSWSLDEGDRRKPTRETPSVLREQRAGLRSTGCPTRSTSSVRRRMPSWRGRSAWRMRPCSASAVWCG